MFLVSEVPLYTARRIVTRLGFFHDIKYVDPAKREHVLFFHLELSLDAGLYCLICAVFDPAIQEAVISVSHERGTPVHSWVYCDATKFVLRYEERPPCRRRTKKEHVPAFHLKPRPLPAGAARGFQRPSEILFSGLPRLERPIRRLAFTSYVPCSLHNGVQSVNVSGGRILTQIVAKMYRNDAMQPCTGVPRTQETHLLTDHRRSLEIGLP